MTYPDLPIGLSNAEACHWLYDTAAKVPATRAIVELGVIGGRLAVCKVG